MLSKAADGRLGCLRDETYAPDNLVVATNRIFTYLMQRNIANGLRRFLWGDAALDRGQAAGPKG
jgi:hypothetical protein